jgi:hypothetical protein
MHLVPKVLVPAGVLVGAAAASANESSTLERGWCLAASDSAILLENEDGRLSWQGDGNLVVYTTDGVATWASGAKGDTARLCFQDDGNLVIYKDGAALWTSGTSGKGVDTMRFDGCGLQLLAGETSYFQAGSIACELVSLGRNWCRSLSEAGNIVETDDAKLVWQSDGNLVFRAHDGTAKWASNTEGGRGQRVCFQDDGNLVVYGSSGALWASDTNGRGVDALELFQCTLGLSSPSGDPWVKGGNFCPRPWMLGAAPAPNPPVAVDITSVAPLSVADVPIQPTLVEIGGGSLVAGDYTVHYDTYLDSGSNRLLTGEVELELADGYVVSLGDAALTLERQANGAYRPISGSAGSIFTNMPGLTDLGFLVAGAGDWEIGYATGADLADLDAPLDDGRSYFYFVAGGADSVSWGGLRLETNEPELVFALDPFDPAFYVRVAGLFPGTGIPVSIDEAAVGFSADGRLRWTPTTTWGVSDYVNAVTGNLYVAAGVTLAPPGVPVGVALSGEALIDVDMAELAQMDFHDAVRNLGANGDADLAIDLVLGTLSFDLGEASVVYRKGQYLAASGKLESEALGGFLAQLFDVDDALVAVYVPDGGRPQVAIDGDLGLGALGLQVKDAHVTVDDGGAQISGTVKIGVTKVAVSGTADASGYALGGSIGVDAGLFSGSVGVRITNTSGLVGAAGSLKACVKVFGQRVCATGGSVSITSKGSIKACVNVAGFKPCITL